jgi:NADPH:quinone reductase-like Zn-dependent oxidoreductase
VAVAVAFPIAGLIGWKAGGRVDAVDAALVVGALTGAGLGAAQWWAANGALGRPAAWIAASTVGYAVGLAVGAALVDDDADLGSLAVMGLVSGAVLGATQGLTLVRHGDTRLAAAWAGCDARALCAWLVRNDGRRCQRRRPVHGVRRLWRGGIHAAQRPASRPFHADPHARGVTDTEDVRAMEPVVVDDVDRRDTMRAIVRDAYGSTDHLELRDMAKPEIGPDEVLVRIHAAGVDRGVWHVMTGLPYPIRLAGFGLRAPKNPVLGADLAGVVESVGNDVTRFQPGDEVFGIGTGSYAEYARAPESKLARKPANLTFEQAAVIAISGLTALQGLRDHGKVQPGHKVLIGGASGGVGTYAVQLAKAFGAEVTAVCGTAKVSMVRSLGADRVIDYTQEDFVEAGQRYDVILDIGGTPSLSRLRRALTPKGTLVIAGGETDGRWLGGTDRQLRAILLSRFVAQKLGTFISRESYEDMIVLKELIEAGKVTPVVDRTFPLSEVPQAIRYLEQGHARGKVVIAV